MLNSSPNGTTHFTSGNRGIMGFLYNMDIPGGYIKIPNRVVEEEPAEIWPNDGNYRVGCGTHHLVRIKMS